MPIDIQAGIKQPKIDMHCHVWKMENWEKSSDHLVECGEALGITELWCSSIVSGGELASPEEVRSHNDTILAAMKRHPKRIRGWCFIIPGHFRESLDEIDRCLDAGMMGIKLYNQYWLSDPAVFPTIERSIDRKVPILEHAGYPVAEHKARQPHISHGKHFTEASEKYPEAMLIHAHIAGGGDWEHTVREMRNASPNVFIDVSGSNLDDGAIEFAVEEMGAERVIFGTDGTMAGAVGRVLDADITEEQKDQIFWSNMERVLAKQGATPTEPRS